MTQTTRETLPPEPLGTEAVGRGIEPSHERPVDRPPFDWMRAFVWAVLVLGAIVLLVPFAWMVKSSLSSQEIVTAGEITTAFTRDGAGPQWGNYPESLRRMGMTTTQLGPLVLPASFPALSNTVVITTLSILGQVLSCSLVGFGFARFRFRGRGVLFLLMLSTLMLPPQVTMIPVFVLFRSVGLIDTIWPLVIPMWLGSPFFVFMFRQFFSQIPEELMEAARIDGASNWQIYSRMMLPLSGPVIAIVAIYTFMGAWNDFLGPLIYLNSPDQHTLALALNSFKGQYGTSNTHLLMAASFLCMLPCVLLFFAAQRYFVQSVASTGMKD